MCLRVYVWVCIHIYICFFFQFSNSMNQNSMLYFGRCLENSESMPELHHKTLSFKTCLLFLLEYFLFVTKSALSGSSCYMLWHCYVLLMNRLYLENSGADKEGQELCWGFKNIRSQRLSLVALSIPTLHVPFSTEMIICWRPLIFFIIGTLLLI